MFRKSLAFILLFSFAAPSFAQQNKGDQALQIIGGILQALGGGGQQQQQQPLNQQGRPTWPNGGGIQVDPQPQQPAPVRDWEYIIFRHDTWRYTYPTRRYAINRVPVDITTYNGESRGPRKPNVRLSNGQIDDRNVIFDRVYLVRKWVADNLRQAGNKSNVTKVRSSWNNGPNAGSSQHDPYVFEIVEDTPVGQEGPYGLQYDRVLEQRKAQNQQPTGITYGNGPVIKPWDGGDVIKRGGQAVGDLGKDAGKARDKVFKSLGIGGN